MTFAKCLEDILSLVEAGRRGLQLVVFPPRAGQEKQCPPGPEPPAELDVERHRLLGDEDGSPVVLWTLRCARERPTILRQCGSDPRLITDRSPRLDSLFEARPGAPEIALCVR